MTVDLPALPPEAGLPPDTGATGATATGEAPEQPRVPSQAPSRAGDFKTCPLLYRFRSIDRIPERPSPDQARGTLVHAVLEALFDTPAGERTPQRAADLVEPQWQRLVAEDEELASIFSGTALTVEQFLS